MTSSPSQVRGILNPAAADQSFVFSRHDPAGPLAPLVEHYWIVRWDLRDREPFVSETLPYPCVNAVLEAADSRAWGVCTRKFQRRLEGRGQVFGIKFRPGGFRPLFGRPVAELTDRSVPLRDVFDASVEALAHSVVTSSDDREMVARVETFLAARLPDDDSRVAAASLAVQTVLDDPHIARVDDLAERMGTSTRTLERLFREYVGVSPKWVIRRLRLQSAAEQVAVGERVNWASLSAELGYFDQSHLIKDFQAQIGCSPAAYAARCAAPPIRSDARAV